MNKTIFAISFTLLTCALFAQESGNTQGTGNAVASSKDNRDLYPLSMYDSRIRLKGVNFVRRHADTGKGEFLDVQVELESRVPENNEYAIYVLAGFEETVPIQMKEN